MLIGQLLSHCTSRPAEPAANRAATAAGGWISANAKHTPLASRSKFGRPEQGLVNCLFVCQSFVTIMTRQIHPAAGRPSDLDRRLTRGSDHVSMMLANNAPLVLRHALGPARLRWRLRVRRGRRRDSHRKFASAAFRCATGPAQRGEQTVGCRVKKFYVTGRFHLDRTGRAGLFCWH